LASASPQHLLRCSQPGSHHACSVLLERPHSALAGESPQVTGGSVVRDRGADLLIQNQQLIDPGSTPVPGIPARLAAASAEDCFDRVSTLSDEGWVRTVLFLDPFAAALTHAAHQALREHGLDGAPDE